ncbi:unnamed protein product [Lupinus luteus]|uniref:Polygalacturonase n=1 Tax=Lupinus luteus TaxID=3873 RepID=A0AAV1XL20_LUPLU
MDELFRRYGELVEDHLSKNRTKYITLVITLVKQDSTSNVCIEDSYISVGDDIVAVKSGWDEYGISYGRPSSNITIRRVNGSSQFAGIAIGSEASGGVENVVAEHINLYNMGSGIHIKTNIGRGGYIKNITISDVYMENVRTGIRIASNAGGNADGKYDPNALTTVKGIIVKNLRGVKVHQAGMIQGYEKSPFTNICLSDINLSGETESRTPTWKCSDVSGSAYQVSPRPCAELISNQSASCANSS